MTCSRQMTVAITGIMHHTEAGMALQAELQCCA